MITTIVLIKADPKRIPEAAIKLAGIEGVQEVYSVSGEWDLVAIVRVTEWEQIAEQPEREDARQLGARGQWNAPARTQDDDEQRGRERETQRVEAQRGQLFQRYFGHREVHGPDDNHKQQREVRT